MAREIEALGLRCFPSDANFLLFSGFDVASETLWQRLLDRGVLIRDIGIPGHLRVTIGTRAENRAFLDALREVVRDIAKWVKCRELQELVEALKSLK